MRRFHLISGLIGSIIGLFIVYFANSFNSFLAFLAFIVGIIIFWFSFTNIATGFAPERYLILLRRPKEQWIEEDKIYVDRVASRISSIEYFLFFLLVALIFIISFLVN